MHLFLYPQSHERYHWHVSQSVQSLSRVRLFAIARTAARQASLSVTNSRSLIRLMSIVSVMPSNHLIHCHPLLLPPLIFPSITGFSSESVLPIRWPEYWSFRLSISTSSEYSGLVSFRVDWLDPWHAALQECLWSSLRSRSPRTWVCSSMAWRWRERPSAPGCGVDSVRSHCGSGSQAAAQYV